MKNTILISIHPKHVEKILNGEKKYEFRKVKPKKQIDKIIIYSTAPDSRVIASAKVSEVIEGDPKIVWEKTKKDAGIEKEFFLEYYNNKDYAIAYKLIKIEKIKRKKNLQEYGVKMPPQSFVYL